MANPESLRQHNRERTPVPRGFIDLGLLMKQDSWYELRKLPDPAVYSSKFPSIQDEEIDEKWYKSSGNNVDEAEIKETISGEIHDVLPEDDFVITEEGIVLFAEDFIIL